MSGVRDLRQESEEEEEEQEPPFSPPGTQASREEVTEITQSQGQQWPRPCQPALLSPLPQPCPQPASRAGSRGIYWPNAQSMAGWKNATGLGMLTSSPGLEITHKDCRGGSAVARLTQRAGHS